MDETLELINPVSKPEYTSYKPGFLNAYDWFISVSPNESHVWKKSKKDIYDIISASEVGADIIVYQNGSTLTLPPAFSDLAHEIGHSKSLMELEENYDDEDGMPISESCWKRAIGFLINYAVWIQGDSGKIMDTPQINPGPNNSIDISWRNNEYRLLINVPADSQSPIHYYGEDNNGENNIGGTLKDTSVLDYFAIWISSFSR